ncbi:DUF6531 domain-containing protein [Acidovorax sp. SUPP950]|uniref:RHS repeat-associated core domain-containing protein n=1 Tax=Acidovorax sp. SUPP950 TaxID=511901 RepID=UPI0023BF99F7|nr:RHS repeat-associated core domain-containing protein [Acidovorax sp. SUPP950]GKS74443.1 DUF6531 domain-containing protein [Acidovorax sp. SUPP950]
MGTHIFSGGEGAITQVANGWTFDPATPVKLKTSGKQGTAWHSNNSKAILIPLGTIKEHGTDMSNRYGAMDQGKHDPSSTIVGWFTNVRDHVNQHVTYVKSVVHEAGEMVVNGVTTLTNAILVRLSPETQKMIDNAGKVMGGMEARHFGQAAQEEVDAILEMLKDPSTYVGLGVSIAATAVQGVPIVGQIAGGAVMADRVVGTGQAAVQAAEEIRSITETWGSEMTPEQLEAARVRLAKWLLGSGAALLAAIAGKRFKRKTQTEGKNDTHPTKEHSDSQHPNGKGPCESCAIGGPVILSSGQKLMDETDFTLPGPIPLVWRRRYRSGLAEDGPWGRGWSHPMARELRLSADGVVLLDEAGRHVPLPHVALGGEWFDPYEKFTVRHPEEGLWVIAHKGGLEHHYRQHAPEQWRLPLARLQDANGNAVALHWAAGDTDTATGEVLTWSARQARAQAMADGGVSAASAGAFAAPFALPRLVGLSDSAGRQLRLAWTPPTPDALPTDPLGGARLAAVELLAPGQSAPQVLARYAYDAQGQLVATHHGDLPYRQYAWRSGVLVGYRKASGHRYFAQYDAEGPQGRVLRSWCADAPIPGQDDDRFTYLPHERITRHTDGLGRVTAYHWDARFNIVATVTAEGTPEELREETPFGATGTAKGSTDPLGRRTTLRHDARGNLTQITNALGQSTALQYNAMDLVTTLRDAMGFEWRRTYDRHGNLVQMTDPLGQATAYQYDGLGRPVEVIDAKGGKKVLRWDEAGNLIAYTDCSGRTTRFAYDALGQLVQRTDALGQATRYTYDRAGRLVHVAEPGTDSATALHQYTWNGEGHLLAYTDPLGATTRYTYDGVGRPLTRMDAAGRTLAYHYDRAGRLIALDNENRAQTTFRYNLRDQLTDEIGFDGRWQRYVYNAASELTHLIEAGGSEAGPGKVTHFERDALGRLLAKRAHGDEGPPEETTYRYDALGRLTQANNGAAHLAFAYDPVGQLLSETQTLIGQGGPGLPPRIGRAATAGRQDMQRSLRHQYDPLGNRTQTLLPDGRTLNWLFYGSGHLHQINIAQPGQEGAHEVIADMERDALHREVERSQGAASSQYEYDPAGRLIHHRAGYRTSGNIATQPVLERAYAYDLSGQLVARGDTLRGRQNFRYDPTGRILAALPGAGSHQPRELFAFDPAGNLLDGGEAQVGRQNAANGRTSLGVVGDNRLRFYQDLHFEYDLHGNVTKRTRGNQKGGSASITTLRWNANHQLVEAITERHGVMQTTRYAYDALGRRVSKADSFGTTHFLWDGDLLVHSQRGGKEALFVYEPASFVPLASIQGTEESRHTYWYQCDQIGAPLELTDAQGRIAWAADYKVWGEATLRTVARTGTDGGLIQRRMGHGPGTDHSKSASSRSSAPPHIEQPFRFQGQQFDEESGLNYNRFRYYDPTIGRFANQDPIGLNGGINLFQYASNPNTWIDPLGLNRLPKEGRYHGPKPQYENPGHHDPSSGKFRGGGSKTSTLPCNHAALAKRSVPDAKGQHWYAIDDKGVIHRFGNSNDGKMHWNGDESQGRGLEIPSDVEKRLRKMHKEGKAVPSC